MLGTLNLGNHLTPVHPQIQFHPSLTHSLSEGGWSLSTTCPKLPGQNARLSQLEAMKGDQREGGKEKSEHLSLYSFALGRVPSSGCIFSRLQLPTVSPSNHSLSSRQASSLVTPGPDWCALEWLSCKVWAPARLQFQGSDAAAST